MPQPPTPALSEVAARIVRLETEKIVPRLVDEHAEAIKERLFEELLDRISTDQLLDALAERDRPKVNHFGGLAHVGRISADAVDVAQSGSGFLTRTVQAVLRAIARSGDYDTSGNFDSAVSALTESVGVSKLLVGTGATADAGGLSARGAGATVSSGLIGQSLGITVNHRFEPAATGSTLNQFGTVCQITGGSGAQTISRVAFQAAAQTGGGGSNQPIAANLVVVQNSADTQTSMVGLEIDVNNNKVDDVLNPTAATSHYALSIVSGGSKLVGPAAISISASTPASNGFWRGVYIPNSTIAPLGYPFDYAGDAGGSSDFKVRADGRVMIGTATVGLGTGTNYMLSLDCSAQAGAILSGSAAGNAMLNLWNRATVGDNTFAIFETEGGSGTLRGSITYNRAGGLVAYNTTSDHRAKEIAGKYVGALDIIEKLAVYDGRMKGAELSRPMIIAHEAQAVLPYAVTGEKDAVNESGDPIYQQMDHQILVPLLLAAIQELRAEVKALRDTR